MAGRQYTEAERACKREWHRKNMERSRQITKAWKAKNPGAIAKYNAGYRTSRKESTPAWANMDLINAIYESAREIGMTVDHIIPLRGETVCGLHVENNLRIVSHSENASKKNRLVEVAECDM